MSRRRRGSGQSDPVVVWRRMATPRLDDTEDGCSARRTAGLGLFGGGSSNVRGFRGGVLRFPAKTWFPVALLVR